jgi:drug/metabolite transporter (DMT)-like permease
MSVPAATLCSAPPARRSRFALDWPTLAGLGALGAIWGASFLFMRVAAPEFGPLALVEVRLALGALVLLPFLWRARRQIAPGQWLRLAGIGAINSAIPFFLFAWAAMRAPAAIGAITNATTVLFAALAALLLFRERIALRQALAMLVGFGGVLVLVGAPQDGPGVAAAALAGTVAAALYGVAANLIRRYLVGLPASAIAAATLLCAALLFLPFALSEWPDAGSISAASWGSAVLLGVLCTGVAYALYFRLIQRVGAPRAVTVTYLVPLFAMVWAWMLLGETPTWPMLLAAALILGSVAASQR